MYGSIVEQKMKPIHFCVAVLFVISFQWRKGVEAEWKIPIHQTIAHNEKIEFLRIFADLGDPCTPFSIYSFYTGERERAHNDCNEAVKGYIGLPEKAQKRCRNPSVEGCRFKHSTRSWYCGLKARTETRITDEYEVPDGTIDLAYCIANLELDPLHRTQTIMTSNERDKRVTVHQTEQGNFFLPHLKRFAAGRDPCAALRFRSDSSDLTNADAQCMNLVEGFKRLPYGAQYRCRDANTAACKRDPNPSDRYSCGMNIKVNKFVCWGGRTETVSSSYCIGILDGLTSAPSSPRTYDTFSERT